MDATDTVKIVTLPDGSRRTIRPYRIADLAETPDGTRVYYDSGVSFIIDLPFDDLYSLWQQVLQDQAWQPR